MLPLQAARPRPGGLPQLEKVVLAMRGMTTPPPFTQIGFSLGCSTNSSKVHKAPISVDILVGQLLPGTGTRRYT